MKNNHTVNSLPLESKVPCASATQNPISASQLTHVLPAGSTERAELKPATSTFIKACITDKNINAIPGLATSIALPIFLQVLYISTNGHHH